MSKFIINGGKHLYGEVSAGGSKNSALAVLSAALLSKGVFTFHNVPDIEDVQLLLNVFESIGVKYIRDGSTVVLDTKNITKTYVDSPDAAKLRGSYYLMGALLSRFGEVSIPRQGGCAIGKRPIDQHIKGFKALGAVIDEDEKTGRISAKTQGLTGKQVFFDCVSVGATINVLMASVYAEGDTLLVNPAKEPHVVDVANFLNFLGAKIRGVGTDNVRIEGVRSLKNKAEYTIIPDQIEVGTFMVAAAATAGEVKINNVLPKHMEVLSAKLRDMGVDVIHGDDFVVVRRNGDLRAVNVTTAVYPGFPTDLQQPFSILQCIANGKSTITEKIYESRFRHLLELEKMGVSVEFPDATHAVINGVTKLSAAEITATDLRAGAALVIAGLVAEGESVICEVEHIDRGYESIEEKFKQLGADIRRV